MTNEEFQIVMLERMESMGKRLGNIEQNMATKEELVNTNQMLEKVSQAVVRIENQHGDKLAGLYDAREVQFDVNERILDSLVRIENKLDRVTLKVATHDSVIQRVK